MAQKYSRFQVEVTSRFGKRLKLKYQCHQTDLEVLLSRFTASPLVRDNPLLIISRLSYKNCMELENSQCKIVGKIGPKIKSSSLLLKSSSGTYISRKKKTRVIFISSFDFFYEAIVLYPKGIFGDG